MQNVDKAPLDNPNLEGVSDKKREKVLVDNPNLKDLSVDVLYHLGLSTDMDLKAMFGDVKVTLWENIRDLLNSSSAWEVPLKELTCLLKSVSKNSTFKSQVIKTSIFWINVSSWLRNRSYWQNRKIHLVQSR